MPINDLWKSLSGGKGEDLMPKVIELLQRQAETADDSNTMIKKLQAQMSELTGGISTLRSQIDDIKRHLSDVSAPSGNDNYGYGGSVPAFHHVDDTPALQSPPTPKGPVMQTLYAIMIDELTLSVIGDADRRRAQFVITAKGDTGIVEFNPESLSFCLANIEGEVAPYFEYTLNSRTPVAIHADNTAKVTQSYDGNWKMERPIHLTIN